MIFRNKALKTTAAAIAIISVVSTGMVNYSYADSYMSEGIKATTTVVKDGKYTVKNTVKYVGDGSQETGDDMARKVLEENSNIEVKEGKITTTLTFTKDLYMFLGDFKVSVDGKDAEVKIDKDNRTMSFDMPSIDSEIVVSVKVTMMGRNVSFKTDFDKSSIEYEEVETPETPDNNNNNNTTSGTIKDGTYTVSNNVSYVGTGNSELGNSMARQVLEEKNLIEVKNGKIAVTLKFAQEQYSFLENFRVSVDGKNVKTTVNKTNRTVSFEIPSIDSEVLVTVKVSIMGRDVSFKTTFDKSSLVFGNNTGNNGNSNNINNGTTNNGTTNNAMTNNGNSNSDDTVTESVAKKGKLYTIKNTVSHSSQTGKEMARKYLNSTSKVEIIDGQTYVTLTFTGSSFMKNHAIYVNGSKVAHTVVSKSGDSISLRFKVPDLSDSIKVGLYVIPMSRNIEFGVTLLEDTLTFVKDFDLNEDGTLPQTGSLIDSNIAIGTGSAMMAVAGILGRRKRK